MSGDVTFGRGVQLRGTVIVVANEGSKIDIADGAILENSKTPQYPLREATLKECHAELVSGNLSIIDH